MTSAPSAPRVDIGDKARASVTWVVAEKWGVRLLQFLVFLILARLLVPEALGAVALVNVVIQLLYVVADQGFAKALIQKQELTEVDRSTAFWLSLTVGVVLAAVTAVLSTPVAILLGAPEIGPYLAVVAIVLVLDPISAVPITLLQREYQFRSLTIRRVVATFVGSIGGVIVALAGGGAWALVAQSVLTSLAAAVILWAMTSWRPRFLFSWSSARRMWSIGVAVMGTDFIGYGNSQSDKFVIGAALGTQQLGAYYVGTRTVSTVMDVQTAVGSQISLVAFSQLQDDRPRAASALYRIVGFNFGLAVLVYGLVGVLAPDLIPFAFGAKWSTAVPVVQILCLMGALNAALYFDRTYLLGLGAARVAMFVALGQAVLGVLLVVIAVRWGTLGVAWALVIRQFLFWPARIYAMRRWGGISVRAYLAVFVRPLILAIFVCGVGSGLLIVLPDAMPIARILTVGAAMTFVYFGVGAFATPGVLLELTKIARHPSPAHPLTQWLSRRAGVSSTTPAPVPVEQG